MPGGSTRDTSSCHVLGLRLVRKKIPHGALNQSAHSFLNTLKQVRQDLSRPYQLNTLRPCQKKHAQSVYQHLAARLWGCRG